MSIGQGIHSSVAWLFAGNTGRHVLTFLFGIVLARLLAPEDFGALITIQVFTGLAGFFAGGGMGQALVRARQVTSQDYDVVFTLQLIIGCAIYLVFYLVSPWFADWYQNPVYRDLLRVSALSFVYRPFVNLPNNILHRAMRFKGQSIVAFASLTASSTASIVMAQAGLGVWSLVWGGIVGSIVNAILLAPLAKWRPRLSLDLRRGRDIAKTGLLFSISDVVYYVRSQSSAFILSHTLGPASVGLFNKGESLARMPHAFVTGSVYPVLFRALAAEQDNLDRCGYLLFRSIALVAVYATPFYVGLLWLGEPLVRGLYGPKWVEAAGPLTVLALAWPFWLMGNLSGNLLTARNWLTREVFVQVVSLVVTCLAILIGLPHGIQGVAWAIVGATMLTAAYQYWLATRCIKARPSRFLVAVAPAVALNSLLVLALAVTEWLLPEGLRKNDYWYVVLMASAGGLVYTISFLYLPFRELDAEQRRWKSKLRLSALSRP